MDKSVKEYLSFLDMIKDTSLIDGDICKTLGYENSSDYGNGTWNVKVSNNPDNLTSFNISNTSLMVEYNLEKKMWINLKALGLKADKSTDAVKVYNTNLLKGLIKKYRLCFK